MYRHHCLLADGAKPGVTNARAATAQHEELALLDVATERGTAGVFTHRSMAAAERFLLL